MRFLTASPTGLSTEEARHRYEQFGPNTLNVRRHSHVPTLLLRQFSSPIVLILIVAATLSFALKDTTDGLIILGIILASGLLGFWQEHSGAQAVDRLLETVEPKSLVLRDDHETDLPTDELVPGDVVLLSAGSGIPADCILLEEHDLFVDEAALTGESYPVNKTPGTVAANAPLSQRTNALFLGSHVISGSGRALVVHTGHNTQFGAISERLRLRPPETEFERGVRRFGYLLVEVTLVLVIAIFASNVYLHRPVLDSFLFALALAVGLTPQLLPGIISVNLARGARRMADQKVIVKRLAAIENFGSMNVLCSDKTGTLTEGRVRIHAALDAQGQQNPRVLLHACLNATYETAFKNPIDDALRSQEGVSLEGWHKLDEVPYDFNRKRLSVLARHDEQIWLITKGALDNVLSVCTTAESSDGSTRPIEEVIDNINRLHEDLGKQGFRTLGVAVKAMDSPAAINRDSETDMTFCGLLALSDPPKPGIAATVAALATLGVQLKIITGDSVQVAEHVGSQVIPEALHVLTGPELRQLSDDALRVQACEANLFAAIEPNQKERIIRALKKAGHVVGYIGDGINDAPALHTADVSISVQGAVDVAKEAADIVLLEQDLAVLEAGVREGRRTFANTLKYVFMATSANFGNMFSMAGASLLLPFLPMLPKQILLTNLLTDLPELTIATDRVDADWLDRPHRWDISFIRRFMIAFGLVSSLFDYLTFGILIAILHAGPDEFRTGWFVESVVSAALIVLVVRTRAPFIRSRPSTPLLMATLLVVGIAISMPYTPLGTLFSMTPLPAFFLAWLGVIVIAYIGTAEAVKRWFYATHAHGSSAS